jgi:hypothetical protein
MTTRQRPGQPGSAVRRALGRSVRALRNLHEEQTYAWERFLLSCRAPQPCRHAAAPAAGGHATTGARLPAPAGAGSSDQAA